MMEILVHDLNNKKIGHKSYEDWNGVTTVDINGGNWLGFSPPID